MSDVEIRHADDGTVWVYSPELNIWTGWEPGEDGVWNMTPADFARFYPECQRATDGNP